MPLKLKDTPWEREGPDLLLYTLAPSQITLDDADGTIERLLTVLAEGVASVADLAATLNLPEEDVAEAVDALDGLGFVYADEPGALTSEQRERYRSNLDLFAAYGDLSNSPVSYQERLLSAHVLVLGVGGVGSAVLQALTGLGVGRFTVLDCDRIERKNLVRQFMYQESDIGRPKVEVAAEWIRGNRPGADVRAIDARLGSPRDVSDLLDTVDLVIGAVDQPTQAHDWVDEACVTAGVPYVFGGGSPFSVTYWSVDPGRSACRGCASAAEQDDDSALARLRRLARDRVPVNVGTGPVVTMVGGLIAVEAMRYLTGFAAPIAAGRSRSTDLMLGGEQVIEWVQQADCRRCQAARDAQAADIARDAQAKTLITIGSDA